MTPRVTLVTSSFAPHVGGVERVVERLALEQRQRGAETIVVTNRSPKDLPASSTVQGIPVRRERFRFPEARPRHLASWVVGTRATRRSLVATLTEQGCELLHVHCVSTNGYYALRAARRLALPLVVSLHGELTMDADGIYERSALMRRTWRSLLGTAAVVTACSQQVADEAITAYGPGLDVRVVPNGVDVAEVQAASAVESERPYLLGVGRLVAQKGFDVLIEAFALVTSEHPTLDLVLAGDGPARAELEAQVRRAGLADRVSFAGSVPPEHVYALMRGATAFVLASRHEPQGIVVLEAMAAGAPVLATRVGGVPETVHDGVNGLLVDGGSVEALAVGLQKLLADPPAAGTRSEQAQRDVGASSWRRVADAYDDCYAAALA